MSWQYKFNYTFLFSRTFWPGAATADCYHTEMEQGGDRTAETHSDQSADEKQLGLDILRFYKANSNTEGLWSFQQ